MSSHRTQRTTSIVWGGLLTRPPRQSHRTCGRRGEYRRTVVRLRHPSVQVDPPRCAAVAWPAGRVRPASAAAWLRRDFDTTLKSRPESSASQMGGKFARMRNRVSRQIAKQKLAIPSHQTVESTMAGCLTLVFYRSSGQHTAIKSDLRSAIPCTNSRHESAIARRE